MDPVLAGVLSFVLFCVAGMLSAWLSPLGDTRGISRVRRWVLGRLLPAVALITAVALTMEAFFGWLQPYERGWITGFLTAALSQKALEGSPELAYSYRTPRFHRP